jgi:hypothetical protein
MLISESSPFRFFPSACHPWPHAAAALLQRLVPPFTNRSPLHCALLSKVAMAAIARPALLRQVCNAAPTRRMVSTIAGSSFKHASPLSRRPMQSAFVRSAIPKAAGFHASGSRPILPPLPQTVEGDVNDPAPVPEASPSHGNYHWTFERQEMPMCTTL